MENPGGDLVRIFICGRRDRWYNCDVLISSLDTEELFRGGTADDDRDTDCGAVLLYECTVVSQYSLEANRANNSNSESTIHIVRERFEKNKNKE